MNSIPALIQKAQDSLRAARLLASDGLFDFAVGRAYFAMYYVAKAFLERHNHDVTDPAAMVDAFGEHFAATGYLPEIFHRYLIDAARLRAIGEYDAETGITAEDVAEQLERAMAFVSLAREELADTSK